MAIKVDVRNEQAIDCELFCAIHVGSKFLPYHL